MNEPTDLEWTRAELLKAQAEATDLLARAEKAEAEVERLRHTNLDQRAVLRDVTELNDILRRHSDKARSTLLNVQTLATQWAVLRTYGSAAYELNRVLAGGPVNQPAGSCPCGSCARPCTEPVTCPDGFGDCHADDHTNPPTVNGEIV
jgi:hypothetical protein